MEEHDDRSGTGAAPPADPWYDAIASGWGAAPDGEACRADEGGAPASQEVRARHRRFVWPATAAFLLWYFGYLIAATTAPGLMARPVAGPLNVALLAGFGQFAATFLLTWAYARHARLRQAQRSARGPVR